MASSANVIRQLNSTAIELKLLNRDMQILTQKEKRRLFINLYYSEASPTFGNAYRSAMACGFKPTTALAMTGKKPKWWQDVQQKHTARFTPEHIVYALQDIAHSSKHDMAKLKAYEMLGKLQGMFIDRSVTQVDVTYTNAVPRPAVIEAQPEAPKLNDVNTTSTSVTEVKAIAEHNPLNKSNVDMLNNIIKA